MKVVQAKSYSDGTVKFLHVKEDGSASFIVYPGAFSVGVPNIERGNSDGYLIIGEDQAIFIPICPTENLEKTIQLLAGTIKQMALSIEAFYGLFITALQTGINANAQALVAAIASAGPSGGTYTPIAYTFPTPAISAPLDPSFQALTQLSQTISAPESQAVPEDIPAPQKSENTQETQQKKKEVMEKIESQEEKVTEVKQKIGEITQNIIALLSPVQAILDLLNSFKNPSYTLQQKALSEGQSKLDKVKNTLKTEEQGLKEPQNSEQFADLKPLM